jgi:gliding motility-associated lipoprotein GldH
MKFRQSLFLLVILIGSALSSCQDKKTIVDDNFEIAGHNWSYTEKVQIPVIIENPDLHYNSYVNLRLISSYKYSNIFLLIHITGPDGKKTTERKEFRLALPDGEWLGSGSGNLYSYQIPLKENFKFALKGKYVIELEQNMRDNPLDHVSDVGVRVEKVN